MGIPIKQKPCKSMGKSLGFKGCGESTLKRTYGLCDTCLYDFYKTDERGKILYLNKFLNNKSDIKSKIKPIKKVSDKRKLENIIYQSERIKFLQLPENRICPITGTEATTIHHKKGRIGSLYLDKIFWIALSMEGHEFVENNPVWAKENGYSLNRLSND